MMNAFPGNLTTGTQSTAEFAHIFVLSDRLRLRQSSCSPPRLCRSTDARIDIPSQKKRLKVTTAPCLTAGATVSGLTRFAIPDMRAAGAAQRETERPSNHSCACADFTHSPATCLVLTLRRSDPNAGFFGMRRLGSAF